MAADRRSVPKDGRCNAKTEGGYCHRYPTKGGTRCKLHGGHQQGWAQRMRRLDAAAQEEVSEALRDPDLLDPRRPIAAIEAVVGRTAWLPSDEYLHRYAQRKLMQGIPAEVMAQILADDKLREEWLAPTPEDLEEARLELHERSIRMLATYSKRQVDAVKQLEWSRVIRETALPLLGELGIRVSKLIRRYLPDDRAEAMTEELRREIRQVLGELSMLRDVK